MSNAQVVRAIGAGERKLGETADMLVELADGSLDYSDSKTRSAEATRVVRREVSGNPSGPRPKGDTMQHRRGNRIDKFIHYAFLINCGLASGIIFVIWCEIWRAVA